MDTVFPAIFFREPLIHYVAPPCCENVFSSSSGPVIILNAFGHLSAVTGLVMGGVGDFYIRWGHYAGAICYSVYISTDPNDPAGTYVLVAECIQNPEYYVGDLPDGTSIIITAITPEGETPFGTPIQVLKVPAQCPFFVPPVPPNLDVDSGDDVSITFVVNEGAGFGQVHYLWFKNGIPILDTTNTTQATLGLTGVTEADEGTYALQLSNNDPGCDIFSSDVTLSIKDCPFIEDPQPDLDVAVDELVATTLGPFNVNEADYPLSVTYQWFKDDVLYSDTTATTQASLEFASPVDTDSGVYTLHISVDGTDCAEVVSNPINFAVGDCAALPQTVRDMVWTIDPETICAAASLAPTEPPNIPDQEGAFSLTFSAACYKAGTSNWVDFSSEICNPGETDIPMSFTLQVTGKTGSYSAWTTFQLVGYLDGGFVAQPSFGSEPSLDATLNLEFLIPPGIHTFDVRIAGDIVGNSDFTMTGGLSITGPI